MSVGEGLAPPAHDRLELRKMYGDFVKCYDFAVHCFIMVALYCREGHTHRGHRRPSPTVFMNNYAKSEFCNAPFFIPVFQQNFFTAFAKPPSLQLSVT